MIHTYQTNETTIVLYATPYMIRILSLFANAITKFLSSPYETINVSKYFIIFTKKHFYLFCFWNTCGILLYNILVCGKCIYLHIKFLEELHIWLFVVLCFNDGVEVRHGRYGISKSSIKFYCYYYIIRINTREKQCEIYIAVYS